MARTHTPESRPAQTVQSRFEPLEARQLLSASIAGQVWNDLNADGLRDPNERGLEEVQVALYDALDDSEVDSVETDEAGQYVFAGLDEGLYYVGFDVEDDYVFSEQDVGGDDTIDSDADSATGQTVNILLDDGVDQATWDAGVYVPGIGDRVWLDVNGNGLQDGGEPGVAGIDVNLYDGLTDTVLDSTTTDEWGNYLFDELGEGLYYVEIVLPAGYQFSEQDVGGDNTIDSDADPATGQTVSFILDEGQTDPTWDAGLLPQIGQRVWIDLDGNGIQDYGEPGLPGVDVDLYDAWTDTVVASTTTGENGFYWFIELPESDYYVQFNPPSGYRFTEPHVGGDDAIDSDADVDAGQTPTFQLSEGQTAVTWDAGLFESAQIGNRVWNDLDADGIQTADEPGLDGVIVSLWTLGGDEVDATVTDDDGYYLFTDVAPGAYVITVETPEGMVATLADQGSSDSADSDMLYEGRTATITAVSGAMNHTVDAGFYIPATIEGLAWQDADGDGIRAEGESVISGANVAMLKDGEVVATTTTDEEGEYAFGDLAPGEYVVQFMQPGSYVFAPTEQGTDDTLDSNAEPNTGLTAPITVGVNDTVASIDAGLVPLGSISGIVWNDADGDGVRSDGESALAGVAVNLRDGAGGVVGATSTDLDGLYAFDDLTAGQYTVEITVLDGAEFAPQDQGGDDAVDSDVDAAGAGPVVTLAPNQDAAVDAGLFYTAAISGVVWNDANGDGIQNGTEAGVPGVTVDLLDDSAAVVNTAVTGPGGTYAFNNLVGGDYAVSVIAPAGYAFSPTDRGLDDSGDSDTDATGTTSLLTLAPGATIATVDAGVFQTSGEIAFGERVKLVFVDADGTTVTLTLARGQAAASFIGSNIVATPDARGRTITVTGSSLRLNKLSLLNTTARSSLSVRARGGADRGTTIGEITGSLPMGAINAGVVDLIGSGVDMTGTGIAKSLTFRGILNGADIRMAGIPAKPVSISAGTVRGGLDISLGNGTIRSIADTTRFRIRLI